MPRLNHENLGSVQKTAYLTATIVSVDSEFDTACFEESGNCPAGTDIPIFYHCSYLEGEEPAQRDNGALEGASGAFAEDDEVIVQCEVLDSTTYKPLYVIGFVDKPKRCGFSFRITRDDETVIDETTLQAYIVSIMEDGTASGNPGITIYKKRSEYPNPGVPWQLEQIGSAHGRNEEDFPDDMQFWTKTENVWRYERDSIHNPGLGYIINFSYDTVSQIWTVPFYRWKESGECFIRFIYEDGTTTWYKVPVDPLIPEYVYKIADRFNDDDLIRANFYEVAVPYFTWEIVHNNPYYVSIPEDPPGGHECDNYPYTQDCDVQVALLQAQPGACKWARVAVVDGRCIKEFDCFFDTKTPLFRTATVKSSVPYEITENISTLHTTMKTKVFSYSFSGEGTQFCHFESAKLTITGTVVGGTWITNYALADQEESFIITPTEEGVVDEQSFTISTVLESLGTKTFVRFRTLDDWASSFAHFQSIKIVV